MGFFPHGSNKVGSGKVGEAPRDWDMKQDWKTPGWTTEWNDMPTAKA